METIEDIIAEIRDCTKNQGAFFDDTVNEWADRIEEALKLKDEATHSQWERAMTLDAENARLRDALKTVLEFPTDESKWWNLNLMYKNAFRAISYAQELYNERTAKK